MSSIFIPSIDDASINEDVLEISQDDVLCQSLFAQMQNSDDGLLTERQAKRVLTARYKHLVNDENIQQLVSIANSKLLKRFLEINPEVNGFLSQIKNIRELIEGDFRKCAEKLDWDIDPALLYECYREADPKIGTSARADSQVKQEKLEEDDYRLAEFNVFTQNIQTGRPKVDLDVTLADIELYPSWFQHKFSKISQINKLRETRAFTGFPE